MQNQNPHLSHFVTNTSSSLPHIYKFCSLNSLFLRTIIYIHFIITIIHPRRRCFQVWRTSKGQNIFMPFVGRKCCLFFYSNPITASRHLSVLEGSCSSGVQSRSSYCADVFTGRDRAWKKTEWTTVNRNVSYPVWVLHQVIHLAQKSTYSEGFLLDWAAFKGQSSTSDTSSSWNFSCFFFVIRRTGGSLYLRWCLLTYMYIIGYHGWYWLGVVVAIVCEWRQLGGGGWWMWSLVTVIAGGVPTAVSWVSECLWETGRRVSRWWSPGGSLSLERARKRSRRVGRAAAPPDTSGTAAEEEEEEDRVRWVFISFSYGLWVKRKKK